MTSKFLSWLISKQKAFKKNKCKHWKKNGAGVLVFCFKTKRFLVHCRGEAGSNAGQYGLFGGSLDLGKNEAKKIKHLEELASDDAFEIFGKNCYKRALRRKWVFWEN